MRTLRQLFLTGLLGLFALSATAAATRARLVLSAESAKPGDTIMAGVILEMDKDWHTYWRNPGEAGYATTVEWQSPPGIEAGEIQWPVPKKETITEPSEENGKAPPSITSYNYEHEVLLLVPLKISGDAKPGEVQLSAMVNWLECETGGKCVKGEQDVHAGFKISAETKASASTDLIEAWKKKLPQSGTGLDVVASWQISSDTNSRTLIVEWKNPKLEVAADFFPYENTNYDVAPLTHALPPVDKVRFGKSVTKAGASWPTTIRGMLVQNTDEAPYEVELQIPSVADSVPGSTSAASQSFLQMLVFAFLGGLILNIMPCVFPVIALKIFGFVQQSHDEPRRVFRLGLIYGLGVLASFLVMAALVIAIKQAGGSPSWGMQFESPQISLGLMVLVVLIALNLFGVFEVNLGGKTMGTAGQLASKHGAAGAFFNGVVATMLATPCTAPVLATALGFAFAQPPLVVLIFFLTIGLGLASPYVLLSWKPGWLKFLPRPGVWMEKFKVAMGFPMLATAVWLFWFTAPRFGNSGELWLGWFFVVIALAAWTWGQFVQRGNKGRGLAMLICLVLVAAGYAIALEKKLHWRKPTPASAGDELQNESGDIPWKKWSPAAIEKARGEGRPILVDFTAKWCPNCNTFVKWALNNSDVRKKLEEINGVPLLADYTYWPADMKAEIKKFHEDGAIPLVLVYPKDASKPPVIFAIPSKQEVLDALTEAAK